MALGYGKIIKEARIRQGLSQVKLAERVGVTRTSIFQWEREQFPPTDANNICALEAALGFANGYLYSMIFPNPTRSPAGPGEDKAVQNA